MTRAEYLAHLGEAYRRVLAGVGDEHALGRRLARAALTQREMAYVVLMARGADRPSPIAYADLTEAGERYPEVWG